MFNIAVHLPEIRAFRIISVSGCQTDPLKEANPGTFYDVTRKIHHSFAALYKSMLGKKQKSLLPDPISCCYKNGNAFFHIELKKIFVASSQNKLLTEYSNVYLNQNISPPIFTKGNNRNGKSVLPT